MIKIDFILFFLVIKRHFFRKNKYFIGKNAQNVRLGDKKFLSILAIEETIDSIIFIFIAFTSEIKLDLSSIFASV